MSRCTETLGEQVKSLKDKIAEVDGERKLWELRVDEAAGVIETLELKLKRYDQAAKTPFIKGGTCNTTHSACDCVIQRTAELEAKLEKYGGHTQQCALNFHPLNTQCTCGWKNELTNKSKGSKMDEDNDINSKIKLALNNLIWMYGDENMTLKEAEERSCKAFSAICGN